MNEHTPGPWHVGGKDACTIYDELSQRIANSFEGVMATQRTDAQCAANARLISAAPELLEALKWVLSEINMEPFEWSTEEQSDAHYAALAAIAKATGDAE